MFQLMRINNRLANATMNLVSGRPDIFNEVFSSENLADVIKRGKDEHGNLHIRYNGNKTQYLRANIKLASSALALVKGLPDDKALMILDKAIYDESYAPYTEIVQDLVDQERTK